MPRGGSGTDKHVGKNQDLRCCFPNKTGKTNDGFDSHEGSYGELKSKPENTNLSASNTSNESSTSSEGSTNSQPHLIKTENSENTNLSASNTSNESNTSSEGSTNSQSHLIKTENSENTNLSASNTSNESSTSSEGSTNSQSHLIKTENSENTNLSASNTGNESNTSSETGSHSGQDESQPHQIFFIPITDQENYDSGQRESQPTRIFVPDTNDQFIGTIILAMMILIMVVGLMVVIFDTGSSDEPPETSLNEAIDVKSFDCFHDEKHTTATYKLRVNATLSIGCKFSSEIKDVLQSSWLLIKFSPKSNLSHESVEVNVTLQADIIIRGRWEIRTSSHLQVLGGPVECGEDGIYEITLWTPVKHFKNLIILEIDAETSDIGWEIDQEGAGENVTFLLMCYYNSSCDLERIVLLGYRNDGNLAPLRPVEFICKTMKGGNEMMCSGSIPIAVVNMTESIVCLPELQNETEALRRATVISKHEMLCSNNTNKCDFKCPLKYQDRFYLDPYLCNIYHRCVNGRLYSGPCANGTFFSTKNCACSHIEEVMQEGSCNKNGSRVSISKHKSLCGDY
uniref:Chitin-binding type-2 domain-containing protein n=1 Tax=Crassostrea virginica TaxID=6565 RepID=A0A8B8EVG1_CRAVI|nr:putative uncharacterized protein DDB_G0282133 isoform X2 [Crassostrea virginica]